MTAGHRFWHAMSSYVGTHGSEFHVSGAGTRLFTLQSTEMSPHLRALEDTITVGFKKSTAAAIAVGAVVVLLIICGYCYWRRHRKRQERTSPHMNSPRTPLNYTAIPSTKAPIANNSTFFGLDLTDLMKWKLNENEIVGSRTLASGAYGQVSLGTYRGAPVAIKSSLRKKATMADLQCFLDEIKLTARFDSPYIIKFIGVAWTGPSDLQCILEYMDMSDLRNFLSQTTPDTYPWSDKIQCIHSIVEGLVYLHSLDIIHRDLKSKNVLLDSVKGTKLSDFGVAREDTQETMTVGVGTYRWMAPEVLREGYYTVAADIYSFGMILSEFGTHQIPYSDMKHPRTGKVLVDTALIGLVLNGDIRPTISSDSPAWIQTMARQCMETDPNNRPTAYELSSIIRHNTNISI